MSIVGFNSKQEIVKIIRIYVSVNFFLSKEARVLNCVILIDKN